MDVAAMSAVGSPRPHALGGAVAMSIEVSRERKLSKYRFGCWCSFQEVSNFSEFNIEPQAYLLETSWRQDMNIFWSMLVISGCAPANIS